MQTRLFHFGDRKSPGGPPTWQGDLIAQWEIVRGGRCPGQVPALWLPESGHHASRPGYLRKNGVPYSVNTTPLTEYWDLTTAPSGDQFVVITSVVQDPTYLQLPFITALHFKKEATGAKWDPTPCSARW